MNENFSPKPEEKTPLEIMKERDLAEAKLEEETRIKTPLEITKNRDSELREKSEECFEDDEKFSALLESVKEYAGKAADKNRTGIERARSLEAAEAALEKAFRTKRGKISREFMGISEKREKMEEESRTNNLAEKLNRAEKKLEELEN